MVRNVVHSLMRYTGVWWKKHSVMLNLYCIMMLGSETQYGAKFSKESFTLAVKLSKYLTYYPTSHGNFSITLAHYNDDFYARENQF